MTRKRLLHLSDLHLGTNPDWQTTGDYKSDIVRVDERQNRVRLLRNSLVALADYLRSSGQSLDAVVITGDVTYQGDPQGFDELPDLLDQLGDTKPEPDHIVIVPGNHDFEWGTSPSSEERYDSWKRLRDDGYVIPYLDGVDAMKERDLRSC